MLDEFPSYEECKDAVNNMNKENSPGLDGLPSEFFQTFWSEIGFIFYEALKDIYYQIEMSSSQKLLVISLVYKKSEKKYKPDEHRLQNCSFRIRKKTAKVLHYLINDNQTAYIKGRFIRVNARLIQDIFEFCIAQNRHGILLFLDFEKAFDSSGSFYIRY